MSVKIFALVEYYKPEDQHGAEKHFFHAVQIATQTPDRGISIDDSATIRERILDAILKEHGQHTRYIWHFDVAIVWDDSNKIESPCGHLAHFQFPTQPALSRVCGKVRDPSDNDLFGLVLSRHCKDIITVRYGDKVDWV